MQTSINNREDGQKAAAAAGLGLAVLAGLSTVSKLAVTADFVEKVPLLLKVCGSLLQQHGCLLSYDTSSCLAEAAVGAMLSQQDCRDMHGFPWAALSCNVSRNPATLNGLGGTCGW